jgi:Uma2 family endonuclease
MSMIARATTAEQLLQAPGLGPCELVRGELVMMTPAGFRHSRIAQRIAARLTAFVEPNALGVVTTADGGFLLAQDPDTVRVPDAAFVCAHRIPAVEPSGFFPGAPDLAVEVLSPNDRASEVLSKVQEWLSAGCRAVWVLDPETHTVSVYQSPSAAVILHASDTLTGGEVLPDFRVPVAELFPS